MKLVLKILTIVLIAFFVSTTVSAQELEDVLETLTEKLELNGDQEQQVADVLKKYAVRLNETMDKYEDLPEDADPKDKLSDLKEVRDDYRKELQVVLTEDQYKKYQELIDGILNEMFTDIAEIKLMDLQKPLELTDTQMEQLAPVMGKSIMEIMKLVIENGDKRMSMPRKIKLGKAMKKIQSSTEEEVAKILTPAQIEKWNQIKEANKNK